ncbi:MAG: hypothetical protein AB8F74_15475 [Saprospiraceae bacterium]
MKKYFLQVILLLYSINLLAHSPDVSTTLLSEQENGKWVLQVKAALTAFEYEVATAFPEIKYQSPEEFKSLVIRHLQNNVSIVVDGNKTAEINKPFVKLGHETNVVFELTDMPKDFISIDFRNSSFKNINKNQSALIILKKGFAKNQFVLNKVNSHTAKLVIKNNSFVISTINQGKTNSYLSLTNVILSASLIGLFLLLIVSYKKNSTKNNIQFSQSH